jgi:competence protein ComEC
MVISHPHADHISGLLPVMEKFDVGTIYDAAASSSSPVYLDLLRSIERKGIDYQVIREGDHLGFGELQMEVYSPDDELVPDDANANSLVMVASYSDMDVLLAGDAESDILAGLGLSAVEVLKVSHHGSADHGIQYLLGSIEPEIAVISLGSGNDYGHPHESTLTALESSGARVYRTDSQGTVRVSLIDNRMEVSTDR